MSSGGYQGARARERAKSKARRRARRRAKRESFVLSDVAGTVRTLTQRPEGLPLEDYEHRITSQHTAMRSSSRSRGGSTPPTRPGSSVPGSVSRLWISSSARTASTETLTTPASTGSTRPGWSRTPTGRSRSTSSAIRLRDRCRRTGCRRQTARMPSRSASTGPRATPRPATTTRHRPHGIL